MSERDRINELTVKLGNLGYLPYQIKNIIEDTIGTTDLGNISTKEEQEIIESLESYISFAIKCRKIKI